MKTALFLVLVSWMEKERLRWRLNNQKRDTKLKQERRAEYGRCLEPFLQRPFESRRALFILLLNRIEKERERQRVKMGKRRVEKYAECLASTQRWRKNNPEKAKDSCRRSQLKRRISGEEARIQREYRRRREKKDINYRLRRRISGRILTALRQGIKKACGTTELLGCSIEQLRQHLEKQFKPGMSWANHAKDGWHIDHIRPCVSFYLTDHMQQKQCFNYRNLQPLWAEENRQKGASHSH